MSTVSNVWVGLNDLSCFNARKIHVILSWIAAHKASGVTRSPFTYAYLKTIYIGE